MAAADDLGDVFSITTRRDGGQVVVSLVGELDLHTADALTAAVSGLLEQEVTRVEVDAGGLSFADSAGLRAVLIARAAAEDAGATFGVTDASGTVERLIEITGLAELLTDGPTEP
jgi:anti-sigma B factor antagonist